jgi:DNA-binding SARP family transcriptional activator
LTEPLSDRVLMIEPEWIQIRPQAELWIDLAQVERCFRRVQGVPGQDLDARIAQDLQEAARLYRGGLQESWYQDWYLYERERAQHMYLILLDKLMGYCESHQRYEDGIAYGDLILRCEGARERTHRRLMRLHYLTGDRTAALRQYERCVHALDQDLGVKPATRRRRDCRHFLAQVAGKGAHPQGDDR